MAKRSILLASASPRRRDLLRQHGYAVKIVPSKADEVVPEFLTVAETTLLNAKKKAHDVAHAHPDELVLAADTLVAFEGRIFGKPRDLDEAFDMLTRLSGQAHEVFSGVWLAHRSSGRWLAFTEVSRVHFRKMSAPEIREYISRVGPLDKAGAYAAQQNEMDLIQSIQGSYTNVVGLPMERLAQALRRFDAMR